MSNSLLCNGCCCADDEYVFINSVGRERACRALSSCFPEMFPFHVSSFIVCLDVFGVPGRSPIRPEFE